MQLRGVRFGAVAGPGMGRVAGPSFAGAETEPERFSSDSDWMPRLVLMAKSTYVWLDQLSRRFSARHPDAGRDPRRGARPARALGRHRAVAHRALAALAGVGADQAAARQRGRRRVGLLARRLPDRRRPRRRGSAYARPPRARLVARHPAGERHGPEPHGHRLALGRRASRVVPLGARAALPRLHVRRRGPVGRPARRRASSRTTTGTTRTRRSCSSGSTRQTGERRYVYHGNDGTSFPWNDTAQLDFLQARPSARHVIQTILAVARRFPVIRFDAAMVLAKKHIERLW